MSEKEILKINEKYTVILDQDVNFKFYATRNGENWRDLTGDKLVLAMFQQLQTAKEENEKLKECFIPLNQKKYYCSKEVYNILEDTNNEWQRVSQLESERVMEIVKLKRENKDLTHQNKQMREALEKYADFRNWERKTEDGCDRVWLEPESTTREAYHGYEIAQQVLNQVNTKEKLKQLTELSQEYGLYDDVKGGE